MTTTVHTAAGSFVMRKPCRRYAGDDVGRDPCGGAYTLHCWCGWRGRPCPSPEEAVAEWQAHTDQEGK